MTKRPKIQTEDEALAYTRTRVEDYVHEILHIQLLWVSGPHHIVGVTVASSPGVVRNDVYIVGPHGGFDRWISLDPGTSAVLGRFLA